VPFDDLFLAAILQFLHCMHSAILCGYVAVHVED